MLKGYLALCSSALEPISFITWTIPKKFVSYGFLFRRKLWASTLGQVSRGVLLHLHMRLKLHAYLKDWRIDSWCILFTLVMVFQEKILGISSRPGIKRSPSAFAHVTEIARIFEGLEDWQLIHLFTLILLLTCYIYNHSFIVIKKYVSLSQRCCAMLTFLVCHCDVTRVNMTKVIYNTQ